MINSGDSVIYYSAVPGSYRRRRGSVPLRTRYGVVADVTWAQVSSEPEVVVSREKILDGAGKITGSRRVVTPQPHRMRPVYSLLLEDGAIVRDARRGKHECRVFDVAPGIELAGLLEQLPLDFDEIDREAAAALGCYRTAARARASARSVASSRQRLLAEQADRDAESVLAALQGAGYATPSHTDVRRLAACLRQARGDGAKYDLASAAAEVAREAGAE